MEIPSIIKNSVLRACLKKKGDLATVKDDGQLETLSVGPDGTILSADSSQPVGFKWVSRNGSIPSWGSIEGDLADQDDLKNALTTKEPANVNIQGHIATKGNPHATTKADIGLGNVTDDAQIPQKVGTAKGSLVGFSASGTPVEIPVGADARVLTADSTQPSGVAWKNVSGEAAAWGSIAGIISNQTDLQTVLQNKSEVNHTHISAQVGLGNVTDNKQVKAAIGSVDGNLVSWSGITGDAVIDSGKKASDFAPVSHAHTPGQVGLSNVTNDAQVKKASSSTDGNLVSWSGVTGDTVQDSGKKLSDLALATHNHDGVYEPANANIQSHIASTANPHNVTADQTLPTQTGKNGKFLTTNGASVSWSDPPAGTPPTGNGFRHVTSGAEDPAAKLVTDGDVAPAAAIAESKLSLSYPTHSNANDPSDTQKAALAGTSGTPGAGNLYVTNADPRNTDARTPTAHGSSAHTGTIGSPSQVGLSNVTNDAQLKAAPGDFASFPEKIAPVSADILLIEDSAASGAKKKVQVGNLPGGVSLPAQSGHSGQFLTTDGSSTSWGNPSVGSAAWNAIASKPEITVGDTGFGSTIQDALTAIGANEQVLVVPPGNYVGPATVPSNVTIRFARGALLTSGTLTINGELRAGGYQICNGGTLVIGATCRNQEVSPRWWGAKGDGSTNDLNAFNAMITAVGTTPMTARLSPGTYLINTSDLSIPENICVSPAPGAIINIATTLTLNKFDCGAYKCFTDTSGDPAKGVKFSKGAVKVVRPEWWGSKANGATDTTTMANNVVALHQAQWSLSATKGTVQLMSGIYNTNKVVRCENNVVIKGCQPQPFQAAGGSVVGIRGCYDDVFSVYPQGTSSANGGGIIDVVMINSSNAPYPWTAGTSYSVGQAVYPTNANIGTTLYAYECTVAGTTSNTEPTWPTTLGQTVTLEGFTWVCKKAYVGGIYFPGVSILGSGKTIHCFNVIGCYFYNMLFPNSYAIWSDALNQAHIEKNRGFNISNGIYGTFTDSWIQSNEITANKPLPWQGTIPGGCTPYLTMVLPTNYQSIEPTSTTALPFAFLLVKGGGTDQTVEPNWTTVTKLGQTIAEGGTSLKVWMAVPLPCCLGGLFSTQIITENVVYGGYYGMALQIGNSDNMRIANNRFDDIAGHGIATEARHIPGTNVYMCTNSTIVGNEFQHCGLDGIKSSRLQNNSIMSNTYKSNGRYGLNITEWPTNNTIIGNNVTLNGSFNIVATSNGIWSTDRISASATNYWEDNFINGDCLYYGSLVPFGSITQKVGVAFSWGGGGSGSFVWEYWNGTSWTALAVTTNDIFTSTGPKCTEWTPPSNWSLVSLSSSPGSIPAGAAITYRYWVRARLNGTVGTTPEGGANGAGAAITLGIPGASGGLVNTFKLDGSLAGENGVCRDNIGIDVGVIPTLIGSTPDTGASPKWVTHNLTPTTVYQFRDKSVGKELTIIAGDSNTTLNKWYKDNTTSDIFSTANSVWSTDKINVATANYWEDNFINGDCIYFGSSLPFAGVRTVVGTPFNAGTGGSITFVWEYWNGTAWTALPVTQSDIFTTLGTNTAEWAAPSGWTAVQLSTQPGGIPAGGSSVWRFWVRARISGTVGTAPDGGANVTTCMMMEFFKLSTGDTWGPIAPGQQGVIKFQKINGVYTEINRVLY